MDNIYKKLSYYIRYHSIQEGLTKKHFTKSKFLIIAFIFMFAGIIKAQSDISQDFESYNIGDSLSHIGWGPYDIQSAVVEDPLASGNKVMENVVHNYNAAPVLMFVLPQGTTLADYDSLTFKGYFEKGDVAYKNIIVQAYQTMPTSHFLDTDTLGLYNRAQGTSTAWENIGIDISNSSALSDTIYIAFGINCAGTANGDTTTWYADDVTLVAKVNNPPPPPPSTGEVVTNGGFEDSNTGIVDSTGIKGWVIFAQGITPAPEFEIVSDTVEQGNRALKATVRGLGTNPWDIQIVADSLHVTPGATYNYSIWAKAGNAGAQVAFTVGNYSYTEYKVIRPANLTTQWRKFSMQFTVNDNQTVIRAPIHFSYSGNADNPIYIDNLQIVDVNAAKRPVIVEAESGKIGHMFSVHQDNSITYISADVNYTGLTSPGDTGRVATYQVTFADSGHYSLYAHVLVGPGGFDDDSFFYGRGFGEKSDTASADWVFVNGLAAAGFSDSSDVVDGPGTSGSQVWKWVNISQNTYSGVPGDTFYVSPDSLIRTFQIGSREDGLEIDKLAFGKSNLYYTVEDLDKGLPGSTTLPTKDTNQVYSGPPLAEGQPKFLGCAYPGSSDPDFKNYWTQLTPENAGKFGSVATSPDTSAWNWSGLDAAYNYAISNHLIFKEHCLIWGSQQPSWLSGMDRAQQAEAVETWIRKVGERYPKMDFVDVVNEAMPGHSQPSYKNALGDSTATWGWVIWAFQKARQYMPNAKLILNEYNIMNGYSTQAYIELVDTLKVRGLIDGIGVQGHRDQWENQSLTTLRSNLNKLTATGIPVYISEMDIAPNNIVNDSTQLAEYQRVFPMIWQDPGVKGITVWGYKEGMIGYFPATYLVRADGTARPALLWLAQYIKDNPVGVKESENVKLPQEFTLMQNFPNPFNPSTNIRYDIPKTAKVTLKIYDILGREVQTLVNTVQAPGQYTLKFNAQGLASGIYFYQLKAGDYTAIKKLMLLK